MKFVIHHHVTVPEHYDLMLEAEETLHTWQLTTKNLTSLLSGRRIEAVKIHDHRKMYLEYEGPVSCDRGHVSLFDSGEYRLMKEKKHRTEYFFSGKKLTGRVVFTREDENFLLQYSASDCL